MSAKVTVILRCDYHGCTALYVSGTHVTSARKSAALRGWKSRRVKRTGMAYSEVEDYCPEHAGIYPGRRRRAEREGAGDG